MVKGSKENNYDTTAKQRMQRRSDRIKQAGLVERKIVMDAEDTEKVRNYAKKLYNKKGKTLKP